jgi:hypothetical protein
MPIPRTHAKPEGTKHIFSGIFHKPISLHSWILEPSRMHTRQKGFEAKPYKHPRKWWHSWETHKFSMSARGTNPVPSLEDGLMHIIYFTEMSWGKCWSLSDGHGLKRDIPQGRWARLQQRHLHTHVYCSTVHNSQVVETTKMPHYY